MECGVDGEKQLDAKLFHFLRVILQQILFPGHRPSQQCLVSFYPASINEILGELQKAGTVSNASLRSTASDMICGTFLRLTLEIDTETNVVTELRFSSNSCGFGIAAAEILCRELSGKHVSELRGLSEEYLSELLRTRHFDSDIRVHCKATVIDAVRDIFAAYRETRLSSFNGDDPLICTCFGVSESTIENAIATYGLSSVGDVSVHCRAGLGCGSCRMLIQEIIDNSPHQ